MSMTRRRVGLYGHSRDYAFEMAKIDCVPLAKKVEPNRAQMLILCDGQRAVPSKLKHSKQQEYPLMPVSHPLENVEQVAWTIGQRVQENLAGVFHGPRFECDSVHRWWRRALLQHHVEAFKQAECVVFGVDRSLEPVHRLRDTRKRVATQARGIGELPSRVAVSLEFEQTPREVGAHGVGLFIALVGLRTVEDFAAFQPTERRRHHDKVAGSVEVERLDDFELLDVGVCDGGNGDVAQVDTLAANQEEEKVERTIVRRAAHGGHKAKVRHGLLGRGGGSSGEQAGGDGDDAWSGESQVVERIRQPWADSRGPMEARGLSS